MLALSVSLLVPERAVADGKFFPPGAVASDPNIPAQSAILVWKEERETLVLESVVDGPGDSFGWVVPLPAEPDEISTCGPGVFRSLAKTTQPEVGRGPGQLTHISLLVLVAVCFACVSSILSADRNRARTARAVSFLGILFAVVTVALLAMPTLSTRGVPGIELLSTTRAGPYEVAVIRGETGNAIAGWLQSNGFAASPRAASVLEEYARQKWCFAAAKLVRNGSAPMSPVPLVLGFATDRPVYPMRLTGVNLDKLQLDLYLIADQRASVTGLETWVADTFDLGAPRSNWGVSFAPARALFTGRATRLSIGHPAVTPLMWPGCVLTRIHGTLRGSGLKSDLYPKWQAPEPKRARVYAASDAWSYAGLPAIWIIAVGLAVATWINIKAGWSFRKLARNVLVPCLLSAGILFVGTRAIFTVVPVSRDRGTYFLEVRRVNAHRGALKALRDQPISKDFPRAYAKLVEGLGLYASEEPADVPGGYNISSNGQGGWDLTVFDEYATPWTIPIGADGRPANPADE